MPPQTHAWPFHFATWFTMQVSPLSGPAAPAGPCAPVTPAGPVAPVGPVAPGVPFTPAIPCGPADPVNPWGPVGPIGPAGPAAPIVTSKIPESLLPGAAVRRLSWYDPGSVPDGKATTTLVEVRLSTEIDTPPSFTTGV